MSVPYICQSCRHAARTIRAPHNGPLKRRFTRPSFAPKPILNLKHIRQNPGLYELNCVERNYKAQARHSWRILEIHAELTRRQAEVLELRRKTNALTKDIQRRAGVGVEELVAQARALKEDLQMFERWENAAKEEMEALALELPNLSSHVTPVGEEAQVLGHVGAMPAEFSGKSHVEIGRELDIIDFEASASTSGWGWYFLKNEGALLEQALIQYALDVAMRRGWTVMTPPSLVYGHIASACGFMPRDQNGETQRYAIAGDAGDEGKGVPNLVLAGTAEIPFAGSQANKTLHRTSLPLKVIGPSRSYRAEAGARGVDTKGLYRVHEFTKVEMFAWTAPPQASPDDEGLRFGGEEQDLDTEADSQAAQVFAEMLSIQQEILSGLGLHAKILEMPTTDLGASASRKVDIEAFFPSRTAINGGFGEVTSASICTDYQSRRLATRLQTEGGGRLSWPYTVNGTAVAVPRVLACLLENKWDESTGTVKVPGALRPYMLGGISSIGPGSRLREK